ncbi:MAG TPA: hypothetical protein VGG65_10015, partial [Thermoanaerobaculia bacterium]
AWDGKRVLPEGFARASTESHTWTKDKSFGYGYKWWILPAKAPGSPAAYAALGYGGQILLVVPELDLITVFTGWNIYDKPELDPRVAFDRVLGAIKDRTP